MKKQLRNGLLILAMIIASVGTFSSCKDNTEEDLAGISMSQSELEAYLQEQIDALTELVNAINSCDCIEITQEAWDQVLADIEALQEAQEKWATQEELDSLSEVVKNHLIDYATLKGDFELLQDNVEDIENLLGDLNNKDGYTITINGTTYDTSDGNDLADIIEALNTYLNYIYTMLNDVNNNVQSIINDTIPELQDQITNINNVLSDYKDSLDIAYTYSIEMYEWFEENHEWLTNFCEAWDSLLEEVDGDLKAYIDSLHAAQESEISELTDSLENYYNELKAAIISLGDSITAINQKLADYYELIMKNKADIEALQTEVETLRGLYDSLYDRLNSLVTSLIAQATDNPVFGSFITPLNISSFMLMTNYGYDQIGGTWPANSSAREYNNELVFTEDDIRMLSLSSSFEEERLYLSADDLLMEDYEGNAGVIYVTVNPNNVDFEGLTLTLVNSQDEESGIKLSKLQETDKVLTFGYTRSSNGFYQAQATLDEENIESVAVDIESNLESSIKSLVSGGLSSLLSNVSSLVWTLYDQFNGILPANALKCSWTADDGTGTETEYAVYSDYKIAATAFTPLSFKFLYGVSSSVTLPTISSLDLALEFDSVSFTLTFDSFELDLDYKMDSIQAEIYEGTINVWDSVAGDSVPYTGYILQLKFPVVDTTDVYGRVIAGAWVNVMIPITGDLTYDEAKVLEQFLALINANVDGWEAEIKAVIDSAVNQVYEYLMEQIDKIAGTITDMINDVITDLQDEFNDMISGILSSVESLLDVYNQVADLINSFLTDANHYFQVTMYYQASSGYYQVSTLKAFPTTMTLGGGNTTTLLATTYSGEIIVPAYKKFVGCTNVWVTGDEETSAVNGDATCLDLLKAYNDQKFVDVVTLGQFHRFPFYATTAGYTYEIVYSAMDYSGVTSSNKYYISVKEE